MGTSNNKNKWVYVYLYMFVCMVYMQFRIHLGIRAQVCEIASVDCEHM